MRCIKAFIDELLLAILFIALLSSFNYPTKKTTGSPKIAALTVLRTKCNVCHKQKNKKKVFTLDNMNVLAPKINKQVFIKKRMPKGKNITLTQQELSILKTWLFTQKIK